MTEQNSKQAPPDSASSEKEDATPKKKPGFFTRLLTEPVRAASDDPDHEDPGAAKSEVAANDGAGSEEEDGEDATLKKKPGFFARLLTEPVRAASDASDDEDSDERPRDKRDPDAIKKDAGAEDGAGVKAESLTTEAFESQLQKLLDQHGKVLAGKVQFVDLSDTKSKFPDRAEEITETLHSVAAKVIRSQLAKEDLYTRLQDSHLIIFAGLDAGKAQQRCVQITNEISELLEGQGVDTAGIVAKAVVGEVKGRAELEELGVEDAPLDPTDEGTDDAKPAPPDEINVRT